jgi:hypothetical protein
MTYAAQMSEADHEVSLFGLERERRAEVRQLEALVGELSVALVVQGAFLAALRHRRARPTVADVDEALASVAENVPEDVADSLWTARASLLARLRAEDA